MYDGTDYSSSTYTATLDIAGVPSATTNAASNIGTTGVTLNGTVNANNASTTVTFEYGTTTGYGTTVTANESPVTGTSSTSTSYSLSGLSKATTYHYRVAGDNAAGTTNGSDQEFTTKNTVSSIVRSDSGSNPTNASSVSWTVTFAASVTGLSSSNFTLDNTGLTGPSISNVTGSGTSWTVTANTGSGSGSLGLNFTSNTGLNAEMSNTLPVTGEIYTIDKTAPTLSSSSVDGSATVNLAQDIILNFDDNMTTGTGNITIRKTVDNSIFEQIPVGDTRVSISSNQVTINPTANFSKGTSYYLEIDATALDDDAGNSYAGISNPATLDFAAVNVVINEVVTDPQQDWSSTSYSGTPGGSPESADEWLELLIKSDGIDFTGWTIELLDGSDVTGDLTDNSTSAFRYSAYRGSGTFDNTVSDDYLILGNVRDGAIDNTITISLKDPSGVVVDEISFTNGAADDIYNETIQRFVNGLDTDDDSNDLTKGPATPGAANTGPSVTLSVSLSSIAENNGSTTLTATLSAASSQETTVNLSLSGSGTATTDSDFSLSSTTITIPAGNTSGTATLTAIQDDIAEGNETVIIDILSCTNSIESGTQQVTSTITDDDLSVTVSIAATTQATEDGTNGLFTISVDKELKTDLTVNLALSGTATDGTDMNSMATSVTIPAGDFSVMTPVTLISDAIAEGDETVKLTLGTNSGAPTGVTASNSTTNDEATVTITDNDLAVEVSIAATTQATEDGTNGLFTISVDKELKTDLTVNLALSGTATDGTDMNSMATSVTIPAGDFSVTTPVTLISDAIAEGDETVKLTLGTNSGAPTGVTASNSTTNDEATVTITDNDLAVEVSIAATTQATEDGTNGLFTISVDKELKTDLTVNLALSGTATDGTDMNSMATSVTIPAGDFSVTTPVTLISDAIAEGDETVKLTLGQTQGHQPGLLPATAQRTMKPP